MVSYTLFEGGRPLMEPGQRFACALQGLDACEEGARAMDKRGSAKGVALLGDLAKPSSTA
jgi:hypothetical protein